jgi:bacterioferritin-associated ferredoxin
MNALFAFIESKEDQTQQAKLLVLPLLEAQDPDRPWTSANFRALYAQRGQLDPVIQQALQHLEEYAIPLLEIEEQLEQLDLETFTEYIAEFEQRFWQQAYASAGAPAEDAAVYLCGVHTLRESDVRGLVQQNLWEVEIIAQALGGAAECSACKRGIQRIVLEELKQAKARKTLA